MRRATPTFPPLPGVPRDALTGLPDRSALELRLAGALDEARARALEMVNEAKAGLPDGLSARQRQALELVATGVVARYA